VIALSPVLKSVESSELSKNILYRNLGKTGIKVPVVSFGVMRADNPNLCKAAYENGIRLFDTANGYQNGNNEAMLGNLFKNYPRDTFYISTKIKPDGVDQQGNPDSQFSIDDFLSKFKTSLSRLQMDYVDILCVHDVRNAALLEYKPLVNALKDLKAKGKIKFIGFQPITIWIRLSVRQLN